MTAILRPFEAFEARQREAALQVIGIDISGDGSDRCVAWKWAEGLAAGGQVNLFHDSHRPDFGKLADGLAEAWWGSRLAAIGYDAVGLGYLFGELLVDRGLPEDRVMAFVGSRKADTEEVEEKYENLQAQYAVLLRGRIVQARSATGRKGPSAAARSRLRDKRQLVIDEVPELRQQLGERRFLTTRRGRIALQPKAELEESPDHFDGLVVAFWTLLQAKKLLGHYDEKIPGEAGITSGALPA